ncbi:Protein of Unknown function [Sinosporangium album]|uniref:DUF2784 domain-containing protein n=1 Tax=Sinosporangium album TaxID=504805 RepID=A0A1G7X7G1_9ACTN|nr:Protein of Unknown function [Sinosporangium album]
MAESAMVAHFLFLGYLALGGFLAWRWPRTIWAHGAVVSWGLLSLAIGMECPLTLVENWGRRGAGEAPLPPSGFIDHYIRGVLYPEQYESLAQLAVAALVAASWWGFAVRRRARLRKARSAAAGRKGTRPAGVRPVGSGSGQR